MMPDQLPLYEIPIDEDLATRLRASADARIQARIQAAQQTAKQRRATRAAFAERRQHGLTARHRAREKHGTPPGQPSHTNDSPTPNQEGTTP